MERQIRSHHDTLPHTTTNVPGRGGEAAHIGGILQKLRSYPVSNMPRLVYEDADDGRCHQTHGRVNIMGIKIIEDRYLG